MFWGAAPARTGAQTEAEMAMAGKEGRTCVPGEVIARVPRDGGPAGTTVRLGSGTSQNKCGRAGARTLAIRTTKAGTLKQQGKREVKRFWVETRHQRYVPSMDDLVVGIVMECHGETYSVDVGGPQAALLPILGFEGATRRNRPMLSLGDVVYARVSVADRDIDPELSCTEKVSAKPKGLGPLKGGYVLKVQTGCSRELLSGEHGDQGVLQLLGDHLDYECCLGVNGYVWVKGSTAAETLMVKNAIENYQSISFGARGEQEEMRKRVRRMVGDLVRRRGGDEG